MRICDNGVYRDATPEEEAEMIAVIPTETTAEQRLEALESAVLDLILGGDSDA